jgi:hypothetical protein
MNDLTHPRRRPVQIEVSRKTKYVPDDLLVDTRILSPNDHIYWHLFPSGPRGSAVR